MLSPEGRCKTLDAAADGYVRAEAVGMLLLQHTNNSCQGMQMLAVIAGCAVNQDGRSSSLTAPNGPAQQEVLRAALADGGLTPADITGLSMHGTGTPLGEWVCWHDGTSSHSEAATVAVVSTLGDTQARSSQLCPYTAASC
jgi:acyl transferase domain-containing protein